MRANARSELEAEETLSQAVERHHPRLVMACSFQKEESVLIDLLMRIEPSARVFTIDTGVLFPETYEVWRKVEDRYGLGIEVMDAGPPNGTPWSASNCCGARKVEALDLALAGVDAWITGIRREQSPTRANADTVEWAARKRRLLGGAGADTLLGSRHGDVLFGGGGRDVANGRGGNDQCRAEVRRHCERR